MINRFNHWIRSKVLLWLAGMPYPDGLVKLQIENYNTVIKSSDFTKDQLKTIAENTVQFETAIIKLLARVEALERAQQNHIAGPFNFR